MLRELFTVIRNLSIDICVCIIVRGNFRWHRKLDVKDSAETCLFSLERNLIPNVMLSKTDIKYSVRELCRLTGSNTIMITPGNK